MRDDVELAGPSSLPDEATSIGRQSASVLSATVLSVAQAGPVS